VRPADPPSAEDRLARHELEVSEAGLELTEPESSPAGHPVIARLDRAMRVVNRLVMVPCMLALLLAACILTYSVGARYFFKIPTEWQDETAIFLLIGATFFSGAFVQSYRGHVGVEAITGLLSARANWLRMLLVELATFVFCAFFAWKSWTLFREALHEGHTSNSTWGPPLWIPYVVMALGMSLLVVQTVLELASRLVQREQLR
jgi:TRAP-type C4-dicarboxylate transport system permease small subunit